MTTFRTFDIANSQNTYLRKNVGKQIEKDYAQNMYIPFLLRNST